MIEFSNLSIGFNHKSILSNLTGSIPEGRLIALMGVNGVGKSCFLKTITLINPAISGEFKIDKVDVKEISIQQMAQIMAVVLTDKIQADFLTVKELISLGRSPHTNFWGELKAQDNEVLNEVIKLLNIEPICESFFADLSDGQKQKVLLARALAQGPRYLFLDEPTTYLDIPSKIELMKTLKVLSHDKKMGVFFSTHDLNLIEDVVDEIWLIDSFGVLHKKSPEEMRLSGLLEKNFNL